MLTICILETGMWFMSKSPRSAPKDKNFVVVLNGGNSAFGSTRTEGFCEAARIFQLAAQNFDRDQPVDEPLILRDINGNRVGFAGFPPMDDLDYKYSNPDLRMSFSTTNAAFKDD